LCAKRRACPPPWPLWTMATSPTCMLVAWGWGPRPSLAWSPPSPCALVTQLNGPHLSRTWATLHWSMHSPLGQRPTKQHADAAWWQRPWHTASFGLAIIQCWTVAPTFFWFRPPWPRIPLLWTGYKQVENYKTRQDKFYWSIN
jgi:hypothetical protein